MGSVADIYAADLAEIDAILERYVGREPLTFAERLTMASFERQRAIVAKRLAEAQEAADAPAV